MNTELKKMSTDQSNVPSGICKEITLLESAIKNTEAVGSVANDSCEFSFRLGWLKDELDSFI
jgi:hypothetical protein